MSNILIKTVLLEKAPFFVINLELDIIYKVRKCVSLDDINECVSYKIENKNLFLELKNISDNFWITAGRTINKHNIETLLLKSDFKFINKQNYDKIQNLYVF